MTLKRINFVSIPVSDQDRAMTFYRDVLGFTVQTDAHMGGPATKDWRWIFMAIPGAETLLHFDEPRSAPRSKTPYPKPDLTLVVDDADAEAARLADADVAFVVEVSDAPWDPIVRWAMFEDTEENVVMIQSSPMEG